MRVLLTCERSGGHIFPALSWGEKLRGKGEVSFFVTSAFLKDFLLKKKFRVVGKVFPFRNLIVEGAWRFLEAVYLFFKLRPNVIYGFGGRDSFFLVFLGALFFLDTYIYEPNIKLGKANRILSFFTRGVLYGFKQTESRKAKWVGIPLRENIKKIDNLKARKALNFNNEQPVILCFGGSQGSTFINRAFIRFVQTSKVQFQIIHLTGKRDYLEILQIYNKIKRIKFVKDFYYAMELLYSAADLVICRAGALSLAEISYYRLPSILIPYPKNETHQKDNALYFKERGAACVLLQENFSFEEFRNTAEKILCDSYLREKMSEKLSKIKLGVSFEEFSLNF